jgi:PIN domain nuclease of toxin-antitoxin system
MILLDTHVVIWSAIDDRRLGPLSRKLIGDRNRMDPFYVSAISSWEIAMLVKKGRLDLGQPAQTWLKNAMQDPVWRSLPIDSTTSIEAVNLPGMFHNDPADRFIVATSRLNSLALITADKAILDYSKAGHVNAVDATM